MVEEPQTETSQSSTETLEVHPDARVASVFLEDFVVTSLLRLGRALSHSDLNGASEGLSLSRSVLRRALESSTRISVRERDFELTLRLEAQQESRQERARHPLESTLDHLLRAVGKPLPLPVIVREVAQMRSVLPESIRDGIAHTLQNSRVAVQSAPNVFVHSSLLLKAGAPNQSVLIRENHLENDDDFARFSAIEYSDEGNLAQRAAAILNAIAQPISQKLLGFLLLLQDEKTFRATELTQVLGDRATFYSFVGGVVTTQNQLANLRAKTQSWLESQGGSSSQVDLPTVLRARLDANEIVVPDEKQLQEIIQSARTSKAPVSVLEIVMNVWEIEPEDSSFAATLQGLNEALRRDSAWLPAGIGRFLLRESVPENLARVPDALRPIHLPIRDTETNEPLDIEMSDDGLEGDCAEFVHDAQREEIGEEVEVKMARRNANETQSSTRYVVTYPHYKLGTMKLRRVDEEFFGLDGALARLSLRAHDEESSEEIVAWASRDSGLVVGVGDWYRLRIAPSGGVLEFERDANNRFSLKIGKPDKLMNLELARVEELESLQERSAYLALFDLLQTVMSAHASGAELPTLWAEINVVRRTSKRLMCSVLSAYSCFNFKQRGPQQILWRFDASKLDQGFKKNKRKFVRR